MRVTFDRKFGADRIGELPTTPGVYLFRDGKGTVIYVGKAKNLRRRLATYRNATRKKAHRKQRRIIRAASSLEIRRVDSEREALLLENELIRTLRPKLNVEGKFDFLYPSLGVSRCGATTVVCFTTKPDVYESLQLQWYGCFRSRLRARDAFDACVDLLGYLGHAERVRSPRLRGSSVRGFRRIDASTFAELQRFLAGEDAGVLRTISRSLLDRPAARRDAPRVHESLRTLVRVLSIRSRAASPCAPCRATKRHTRRPVGARRALSANGLSGTPWRGNASCFLPRDACMSPDSARRLRSSNRVPAGALRVGRAHVLDGLR